MQKIRYTEYKEKFIAFGSAFEKIEDALEYEQKILLEEIEELKNESGNVARWEWRGIRFDNKELMEKRLKNKERQLLKNKKSIRRLNGGDEIPF